MPALKVKGNGQIRNSRKEESGKAVEGSPTPPSSRTEFTSEKGLSVRLAVPYNALVVQRPREGKKMNIPCSLSVHYI